jgi:hypothetical protein
MQDTLSFIIYISRAHKKLEKLALVDLCAKAAANNLELNITGLLLCIGNSFVQVLEGQYESIHNLYKKISKDPRHTQCRILFEGTTPDRLFGQWNMNFVQMDEAYFLNYEDLAELRKYIENFLKFPDKLPNNILELIQRVPKILKTHKVELDILAPVILARGKAYT